MVEGCKLYKSNLLSKEDIDRIKEEHKDFFIEGITFNDQRTVVKHIASQIYRDSIVNKKTDEAKIKQEVYNNLNTNIQDLAELIKFEEENEDEDTASSIEATQSLLEKNVILRDNIDLLFNHANDILRTLNGVTLSKRDDTYIEGIVAANEDNVENVGIERTTFSDNFYFELDTKDTSSARLKKFLAFVPKFEFDEEGDRVPSLNLIGTQEFLDFDYVFNELHRLLAGKRANMQEQLSILKTEGKRAEDTNNNNLAWLTQFVDFFENHPEDDIKKQFVSEMAKHKIDMKFINIEKNWNNKTKQYDYSLRLQNDNSGSISNKLLQNWKREHLISNIVKDGVYVDSEKQILIDILKGLQKNINKANFESELSNRTHSILRSLGIIVNKDFWDTLFIPVNGKTAYLNVSGKEVTGKTLIASGRLFEQILKDIPSGANVDSYNIISERLIEAIATDSSKFEQDEFSNSFRVGDKTIYTYSMNQYMVNRYRGLLEDPNLIKQLNTAIFSQDSLYLNLLENSESFKDKFNYGYVSLNPLKVGKKRSDDVTEMGELDHEVVKIGHYNTGYAYEGIDIGEYTYKTRLAEYFFPTNSDKSRIMSTRSVAFECVEKDDIGKPKLTAAAMELFYNAVILPEVNRIVKTRGDFKKAANLSTFKGDMFYFSPELNTLPINTDVEAPTSLIDVILAQGGLTESQKSEVKIAAELSLMESLKDKITSWENSGIIDAKGNVQYIETLNNSEQKELRPEDRHKMTAQEAALDMLFNYRVYDANMFQLIIGDPAQYSKKDIENTYANIGKRLAAEIAPGIEMEGPDYIQIYADDIEVESSSIEYLTNSVFKDNPEALKKYKEMKSTDAQEYTTWREHLNIMYYLGRINQEEYDEVVDAFTHDREPSKELFHKVLQPMKPVYVYNDVVEAGNQHYDKKTYIKSSSFPLIPSLTKGFQIDALRLKMEALESLKGLGVRLAYRSAVKVGFPNQSLKLNKDNKGNFVDNIELKGNYEVLRREGFRIQQDVPYDEEKSTVNKGTQELKLIWANFIDPELIKSNPKEYKRRVELKEEYTDLYKQLYIHGRDELDKRLKVNGKIDNFKLSDILLEELKNKGENSKPLLDGLQVDENGDFITPLWMSPFADNYMSLINSIVKKHILAQKFTGKSMILGANAGMKSVLEGEEGSQYIKEHKKGIVTTSSYDDIKGLQGQRVDPETGNILGAQVFMPFKFRDNLGKLLDVNDFKVKGTNTLDLTKIPKDLLELFGFRIPTQLHASMALIEVVGFLPYSSGDLIIAPAEFTVQMGSDFDIDKLYTYMFATKYDKKTKTLSKKPLTTNKDDKDYTEGIHNRLLDIHLQLMKEPSLQESIHFPLGMGLHSDMIKQLDSVEHTKIESILSDEYQKRKFYDGTAGKNGCLGYGTKVLMFDGTFKEVQDVIVGDQLMGIDSTPRNVLELKRGVEQMYYVYQKRGITYRVNESHILSLKKEYRPTYFRPQVNKVRNYNDRSIVITPKKVETINISILDYFKTNDNFKKTSRGYKSNGINFPLKHISIDPYYIGLWLGDGVTKDIKEIATVDAEIIDYLTINFGIKSEYGLNNISRRLYGDKLNKQFKLDFNSTTIGLLPGKKHIPDNYLYTSKENRLKLLAGLIDSDGHYCKFNKQYTFTNTNKLLIDQVAFLTRSLGFYTSVKYKEAAISKRGLNEQKLYWVTFIPECSIPCLLARKQQVTKSDFKNRLVTGISIKKDTVDNYYGFVLDGDHLFMLEDFTVTHNTGMFSIDSVFNVLAQGKNLTLMHLVDIETDKGTITVRRPVSVKFGTEYNNSTGDLSSIRSLKKSKPRYKTEVVAASQNLSVDNANEQGMYRINMNQYTFPVYSLLNFLGFEEDISDLFMTQPIIREYVQGMRTGNSILKEYNPDREKELVVSLIKKYLGGKEIPASMENLADFNGKDASAIMLSLIKDKETHEHYDYYQVSILNKFIKLKDLERPLSSIKQLLNIDSKGFSKSMYTNKERLNKIYDDIAGFNMEGKPSTLVDNALSLFGENVPGNEGVIIPTTNAGFDNIIGNKFLVDNFADYFLESTSGLGFSGIVNEIKEYTDKESINEKELGKIKEAYKNYLLSNIVNENAEDLRKELFLDKGKGSFYDDLKRIKETKYGKNNIFLNSLNVNFYKSLDVDYNNGGGDNFDESNYYKSFVDLFINGNEYDGVVPSEIGEKLITYSLLRGGNKAQQFIKFIPITVLQKLIKIPTANYNTSIFTDQYIRHNANKVPMITEFTKGKDRTITLDKGKYRYVRIEEWVQEKSKEGIIVDKKISLLYKFDHISGDKFVYVTIDELGIKNTDEYSPYDKPRSIFTENIVNKKRTTEDFKNPLDISYITQPEETVIEELKEYTQPILDTLNFNSLTNLIYSIGELENQVEYDELANIAATLLPFVNSTTKLVKSDEVGTSDYNTKTDTITVRKNDASSNEDYLRTILHETLHSMSQGIIDTFEQGKYVEPKLKEALTRLNKFKNSIVEDISKNPEELAKLRQYFVNLTIENLKIEDRGYLDSIIRNPTTPSTIKDTIARTINIFDGNSVGDKVVSDIIENIRQNGINYTKEQRALYYSLMELSEFVAVSGSFGAVRDNLMKLSGDTYIDKIKTFFKELLEFLGISNEETQKFIDDIFLVSGVKETVETKPMEKSTKLTESIQLTLDELEEEGEKLMKDCKGSGDIHKAEHGMNIPNNLESSSRSNIFTKGNEWSQINYDGSKYAEKGAVIPKIKKESKPLYSSHWKIITDLKGASHEQGGIQLDITDGKVHFVKGDSKIHAKCGCLIRANKPVVAEQGVVIPNKEKKPKFGRTTTANKISLPKEEDPLILLNKGFSTEKQSSTSMEGLRQQTQLKAFKTERVKDIDNLTEIEFKEKYGTTPHRLLYDTNPKYKEKIDIEGKKLGKKVGTIDYPNTDVRKEGVITPNTQFMFPELKGKSRQKLVETTNDLISSVLPIPGVDKIGKLPGILDKVALTSKIKAVKKGDILMKEYVTSPEFIKKLDILKVPDPQKHTIIEVLKNDKTVLTDNKSIIGNNQGVYYHTTESLNEYKSLLDKYKDEDKAYDQYILNLKTDIALKKKSYLEGMDLFRSKEEFLNHAKLGGNTFVNKKYKSVVDPISTALHEKAHKIFDYGKLKNMEEIQNLHNFVLPKYDKQTGKLLIKNNQLKKDYEYLTDINEMYARGMEIKFKVNPNNPHTPLTELDIPRIEKIVKQESNLKNMWKLINNKKGFIEQLNKVPIIAASILSAKELNKTIK